jgi:RNA polymerase sigma factor (sigma-70 family)
MQSQRENVTPPHLDEISTQWNIIHDPAHFVQRYSPAIRRYVRALVRNCHDAEEVVQDFFLRITQHGFIHPSQGGRFRDYLKAAVRNAARNYLCRNRDPKPADLDLLGDRIADKTQATIDQLWDNEWRKCLLERACRALEEHQSQSRRNLCHIVLNLIMDNPLDDSKTLAARTSALIGRPVHAEGFRQQVSRARRLLARLLVQEVAQTLGHSTPAQIKEELIALGLWEYIRDHLTPERRPSRRKMPSPSSTPKTSS